jgi:hypothetical protein
MSRLDCEEVKRLIHLQLDGELGDDDARLLEEHLQACEGCRALHDDLLRVDAALREGFAAIPLPEPSTARVRARVAQARGRRVVWTTWLPAAAAFLLVFVALVSTLHGRREPVVTSAAPAIVIAGGDAVHVFEPNERTAQPGRTGTALQESAVAWGLGEDPITLEFANGAQVELNDEAVVRIGRDSLDLYKGDLRADLTEAEGTFSVVTPWGEFSGEDALFTVYSNNDGTSSRLTVLEGEVALSRKGTTRTVGPGETIKLQPDPQQVTPVGA